VELMKEAIAAQMVIEETTEQFAFRHALAQGQIGMALEITQELLGTVPGAGTLPDGQPVLQLLKLQGESLIALGRIEEAIPVLQEAKRGAVGTSYSGAQKH